MRGILHNVFVPVAIDPETGDNTTHDQTVMTNTSSRERAAVVVEETKDTFCAIEEARYLLAPPPSPLDRNHKVRCMYGNGLRPDIWERL
jgi:hypothetical protein